MLDRADTAPLQPEARVSDTTPVGFRGAGFVPATNRSAGWVALAVVLALWQLVGGLGLVNPLFLPTPFAILRAMGRLAASGAKRGPSGRKARLTIRSARLGSRPCRYRTAGSTVAT